MTTITLIGIDPGMVDTGAVTLSIDIESATYMSTYLVLPGGDWKAVYNYVHSQSKGDTYVYVEKYTSRGNNFNTNAHMQKLEQGIANALPKAKFVDNMGVKKVVKQKLMHLFGLWTFNVSSNHQDLRSAAYILFYGALKNEMLNQYLTAIVIKVLMERGELKDEDLRGMR